MKRANIFWFLSFYIFFSIFFSLHFENSKKAKANNNQEKCFTYKNEERNWGVLGIKEIYQNGYILHLNIYLFYVKLDKSIN